MPTKRSFHKQRWEGPQHIVNTLLVQNRTQNEIRFAGQPKIICLYNIETYYPRARAHMRDDCPAGQVSHSQDNQAKRSQTHGKQTIVLQDKESHLPDNLGSDLLRSQHNLTKYAVVPLRDTQKQPFSEFLTLRHHSKFLENRLFSEFQQRGSKLQLSICKPKRPKLYSVGLFSCKHDCSCVRQVSRVRQSYATLPKRIVHAWHLSSGAGQYAIVMYRTQAHKKARSLSRILAATKLDISGYLRVPEFQPIAEIWNFCPRGVGWSPQKAKSAINWLTPPQ